MRIRWRNFELPSKVQIDQDTLTNEYGRFVVEPFERGFGHTIGNGLRRVLLSSIEGTAITSVSIEGAKHEHDALDGVYEDVTDIILNLKRLRIRYAGSEPITCKIAKDGKGEVTGADVVCQGDAEVVNKDLHIATLSLDRELEITMQVHKGRGYVPAEEHAPEVQDLGRIPIDAIYSPVHRVRYSVEATRVGKFTNYDKVVLEVWTDGTVSPEQALTEAARIYRKHLNPFVLFDSSRDERPVTGSPSSSSLHRELGDEHVGALMDRSIGELELSVRARNCLDSANITTIGQLVTLSETEVSNLKNLGKTSMNEIKSKLANLGMTLGQGQPA
jgi:DNA-directed RNA polymerase subunit alpha